MFRTVYRLFFILIVVTISTFSNGAFTPEDYKRALWMTTRFYGAQRSGEGPNWLLMEHDSIQYRKSFMDDSDNDLDLSGAWFDCGDHVTFGQTFFYTAYLLAKAYKMFPTGFHDLYCGDDYRDYVASGNWDQDGGRPNGIPDLLEELKYATDWIIKATPDESTFYYQKGEGAKDHKLWVTAGKMSTFSSDSGGGPRTIYKNPDDGVMPSMAAAALILMSDIYRKYDPDYAAKCLEHAKNAYSYAKNRKNNAAGAGDNSFYGAHAQPAVVAFITASSEMFAITGEEQYKNAALAEQDNIKFHNWGFDYSNTHDLAPLCMATSGIDTEQIDQLKTMFIDQYSGSTNDEGVCTKGNRGWGALRYPANHAFITALWAQFSNDATLDDFIFKQVDYILGNNNAKQSFVVGFCSGCTNEVLLPHHRNVFLNDDNPDDSAKALMVIPERNRQFGYLVGGTWSSSEYHESVTDYAMTEGGLDYNAGLVGALGYIVSKVAPADTANMVGVKKGFTANGVARQHADIIRIRKNSLITAENGAIINKVAVNNLDGRCIGIVYPGKPSVYLNSVSRGMKPGIYVLNVDYSHGKSICLKFCKTR